MDSVDPFRPLFSSDLAQDVRSEFYEHTSVGLSASTATAHVFDRFRGLLTDPNEGPVIIVCIAALQLAQGQLDSTIRDAAVDLIESGEAAASWKFASSLDSSKRGDERDALLQQLADELRAASPSRGDDVESDDE